MSMTPDQYIEAKKGAMRKKTDRKLWLEKKIIDCNTELEDKNNILRRDQKVIDKLERMKVEYNERVQAIDKSRSLMDGLHGEMFDEALIGYMNAKTALEELEVQMRSVYYSAD